MIVSCETYRTLDPTCKLDDSALTFKLEALELLVRKYTNNNFQNRAIRLKTRINGGKLTLDKVMFKIGDTVEISQSQFNNGVYNIVALDDNIATLNKTLIDEDKILVTLVQYPTDVVLGVINLIKWDNANRDKVGISSETISRHSVSYFNMDGDNSIGGYPKSLMGFLSPYIKARF